MGWFSFRARFIAAIIFTIVVYLGRYVYENSMQAFIVCIIGLIVYKYYFYFYFSSDTLQYFKRKMKISTILKELKMRPYDSKNHMELGELYFEDRNYHLAIQYFEKSLIKSQNSPRIYAYLGMSYIKTNDYGRGQELIYKAIELDKKILYGLPYIYLLESEICQEVSDIENIKKWEELIERFGTPENFYKAGRIFKKYGHTDRAVNMFRNAKDSYSFCSKSISKLHRKWARRASYLKSPMRENTIFILSTTAIIIVLYVILFRPHIIDNIMY